MKLKKYLKQKNYLMQLVFTIAGFCCIPLILMQLIMMEQSTQGYSKMNEAHNRIDEYSTDDFTAGVWFDAEDRVLFNQVNITPKRLFEILGEENTDCREMIQEFFEKMEHTRVTSTAQ